MTFEPKKHVKSSWIVRGSDKSIVEKPWGYEHVWAGFSGIHGKTLYISKGCRTSFKYHQLKSEVLFLRSGIAEVVHGDECSIKDLVGHPLKTSVINPGDIVQVQSGSPYRITALTDCEIIEIGNYLSDKPTRIDDDYGRQEKKIEDSREE